MFKDDVNTYLRMHEEYRKQKAAGQEPEIAKKKDALPARDASGKFRLSCKDMSDADFRAVLKSYGVH